RITREKCGKDAAIGFAQEHANSQMVVPELYNGAFRKNERSAAMALEQAVAEWEGTRRKR
ncbi:hypothetical protein GUG51_06820, partial [Xanthomonas citri pv. citri]|nr:hypothetical protein [Xanthomonas citri pv. citri]